ncbi:MAG: alanine/glycine:cation symporter family protein [Cytophagaceae bacterium]
MKKLLFAIFTLFPTMAFAQNAGLDDRISEWVEPVAKFVSGYIFYEINIAGTPFPIIVIWLLTGAIFFTVYMWFINFRGFRIAIQIVKGCYDDPNDKGEVSHFQALATALSGTVGLGNIAGVAVAISKGGPGATFWMILAGLLGMTSKFVECTLGVKYRRIDTEGTVSGGPMYYLQDGLSKKGWPLAGKVMGVLFAILCIGGSFGGGNMFQGNQAATQLVNITGGPDGLIGSKFWVGLIMAVFVGIVIIGGVKSIARVTEKIVPFMCGIYMLAGLVILGAFYEKIPGTFYLIFKGAFNPDAVYGGVLGVLVLGFVRASFSNEAGVGSASIAHSAVKTNEPVSEGLVSLLEPFIDTVIVCTVTALVIIITDTSGAGLVANDNTAKGIAMTSLAFGKVISWFPYVLAVAVVLFAFSTMISWSYYGLKAWTFLFGEGKLADLSYKFIFCVFVVIGATMSLGSVIDFSDAMIFAMSFPNMLAMYIFSREVKDDLASFLRRIKSGEIKKFK